MTKPLLTLESIDPVDRPYITIDGDRFDLAVREDFGLVESARMARLLDISQRLTEEAMASPADKPVTKSVMGQLESLVDEQVSLILRPPSPLLTGNPEEAERRRAAALARLNSSQKLEIIAAFTAATAESQPAPTS